MSKRNKIFLMLCGMAAVVVGGTSCGYRAGGYKPAILKDKETAFVEVFSNHTIQPMLSSQTTAAVCDMLQRDGTYRLASPQKADIIIKGNINNISRSSLRTNPYDSYLSSEVQLTVQMNYQVVDRKSGKLLMRGSVYGSGSNLSTTGNVQGAVDNALNSAAIRAAEALVTNLTMP